MKRVLFSILILLIAFPVTAQIPERYQSYLVFLDDFNQYKHEELQCWTNPWELWLESPGNVGTCEGTETDNWPFLQRRDYPTGIANDTAWRPGFLTTKVYCNTESALFIADISRQNLADSEPEDWTDITLEVDVNLVPKTTFGIVWEMLPVSDTTEPTTLTKPSSSFVFLVEPYDPNHPTDPNFPLTLDEVAEDDYDRGGLYSLYQIDPNIQPPYKFNVDAWTERVSPSLIVPSDPSVQSLTYMLADRVYVFQLTWYREELRVRYMLRYGPSIGTPTVYYGCQSIKSPTGICTERTMQNCWCEIINDSFVDDGYGSPGAVGLFISGAVGASCEPHINPQRQQSFDNFKSYAYRPIPPTPTATPSPTPVQ